MLVPFFFCWGSFLNVVAYRLVHGTDLFFLKRSFCPKCKKQLAWYDLIPILSWVFLRGKCRYCDKPISYLYPFIELLTVFVLSALFIFVSPSYWLAYFIFFSALIVTIRSDSETMLISRFVTIFLVPLGFLFSYFNYLPITFIESVTGTFFGYMFLFLFKVLFSWITGKEGIGSGDPELIAFIGSFTGITGCWFSLLFGSIIGSMWGIGIMLVTKSNQLSTKIPFGPFLAFGALIFVLFQETILRFIQ